MRCIAPVVIALLAFSTCAAAQEAKVTLYGQKSVVRIIETPQFPPADANGRASFAESRFTDFQTLQGMNFGYFGAFALSADGANGMSGQQHNLADARAAALAECEASRGAATGECRIVAERLPEGHTDDQALTLSQMASKAWPKYAALPGPKAYAIGTVGNWGASARHSTTLADARKRALDGCTDSGIYLSPPTGGAPCRIIDQQP